MVKEEFKVTPWEVKGEVDYDKLVNQFGTQRIDEKLLKRLKKPLPALLRRGYFFSHRDLDKFLDSYDKGKKISIVSGRGPSQKMHIGHIIPYLIAKYFQDKYGCEVFLPVSEDEKFFVKDDLSFESAEKYAEDNILDLIAVGFDPKKTKIHRDFQYTHIYRYAAQIAKHVTYSTAKAVFGLTPDQNIGWSFYPAMQAAHILLPQFLHGPHLTLVPIGIDQDPFMRITRDVAEHPSFKFIKPGAIHSKFLPSLQGPGTKMSASEFETALLLSDDPKTVEKKIMKYAFSGGRATVEEHRKYGGNPDVDVSYQWLTLFEEDDKKLEKIYYDYKSGKLLTSELKKILVEKLNAFIKEHQKRKESAKKQFDKFLLKN